MSGNDERGKSNCESSGMKRCQSQCRCLVVFSEKKKSHSLLNSRVPGAIAVKQGMHPMIAINSCDEPSPGIYHPEPIIEKSAACNHVTSWKREEAAEEFAAMIQDRLNADRKLKSSSLGPGSHEVKRWPDTSSEKSSAICPGFGIAPRFGGSKTRSKATPGPGYTGKDHNPYYFIEQNRLRGFSCLPTFEFDGFLPRSKNANRSWSVAPNRYNPQHPGSLDKILKKVTSRRGPYDLFTGPRNATSLYGYMGRQKSSNSKNWPAKFPTEFEKAFGGSNRYKGTWTDCPRFSKKPTVRSMLEDISLCYKDPDSPGPGSYDPERPWKPVLKSKHPFNDSVKNVRPLRPWEISPGPAAYDLAAGRKYDIPGNGWTSIFKSKVQRRIGPRLDQYNSF